MNWQMDEDFTYWRGNQLSIQHSLFGLQKRRKIYNEETNVRFVNECYGYRFCVPAFAVDTATTEQTEPVVFKSNTLPDWFPEDAPAPDPHGEIVTVYWYVDENGNTVTYNPAERKTATGNAGTATIYWVDAHMVTWGITSNAGGAMVFTGTVSTNRGQIFVLGDIEFDGDCGGTIDNVTTLKGKNTATLSGFMIDSRGISITAPDVSSNYYR